MGSLDVQRRNSRVAYGALSRAILECVAADGPLTLAVLSGSARVARAIPRILARADRRTIQKTLRRLDRLSLITMTGRGDGADVAITERGMQRVLRCSVESLRLQRPKRWDHRWRLVIFDIPESHRVARRLFQRKLRSVGFAPIQRSVYVTPFPCADALDILYDVFEVRPFVHCIEIPSLGRQLDTRFRSHFGLQ